MSKLALSVSRGHPGCFPKVLLIFRWAAHAYFQSLLWGCLSWWEGPHLEAQEGRDGGSLGTGSVQAAPVLGVASPPCPSPHPHSLALHHRISLACTVSANGS